MGKWINLLKEKSKTEKINLEEGSVTFVTAFSSDKLNSDTEKPNSFVSNFSEHIPEILENDSVKSNFNEERSVTFVTPFSNDKLKPKEKVSENNLLQKKLDLEFDIGEKRRIQKKQTSAEDHLKHLLNIGWKKDSVTIRNFVKEHNLNLE